MTTAVLLEAQFNFSLKYHPGCPWALRRHLPPPLFAFCGSFFPSGYMHRASAMPFGSRCSRPDDVHHHRAPDVLAQRRTYPASRLGPSPRTLRPRHHRNPPRFPKPSGSTHPPLPQSGEYESVNTCRNLSSVRLKVVDRFRLTLWESRPLSVFPLRQLGLQSSKRPSQEQGLWTLVLRPGRCPDHNIGADGSRTAWSQVIAEYG